MHPINGAQLIKAQPSRRVSPASIRQASLMGVAAVDNMGTDVHAS
jgi:hypothetical protein